MKLIDPKSWIEGVIDYMKSLNPKLLREYKINVDEQDGKYVVNIQITISRGVG